MCSNVETQIEKKTVKYIEVDLKDLILYRLAEIMSAAEIIIHSDQYDTDFRGIDKDEYNDIVDMFLRQENDLKYYDKEYRKEYKSRFGEKCVEKIKEGDIDTLVMHYILNKYDLDTVLEISNTANEEEEGSLTVLLNYKHIKYLDLPIVKEEELLMCLDEEKYRDP